MKYEFSKNEQQYKRIILLFCFVLTVHIYITTLRTVSPKFDSANVIYIGYLNHCILLARIRYEIKRDCF